MITRLVSKLSKSETEELTAQSAIYRAGNLSHADFYTFVKKLCAKKNVGLDRYPAMDQYIRYVLLSDSLDVDAILEETTAAEKNIYSALAHNEKERRLITESRLNFLVGKLLDFALTKEEWTEYQDSSFPIETFGNDGLKPFESFYREAEARDEAMAANLEKAMDASHAKVAVLVTGGFHSNGLARQLQPKGFTVVSYVPKISKIEDANGSAYLSVFTQEKTPLDKLFAGEKLFLAAALPAIADPIMKEATLLTSVDFDEQVPAEFRCSRKVLGRKATAIGPNIKVTADSFERVLAVTAVGTDPRTMFLNWLAQLRAVAYSDFPEAINIKACKKLVADIQANMSAAARENLYANYFPLADDNLSRTLMRALAGLTLFSMERELKNF